MLSLTKELEELESIGLKRRLRLGSGIDFSSNDYLGFSQNPNIRAKLIQTLQDGTQLGATGSRLISGNSKVYEETESFIARTFQAPSALIFGSGFLANLGVITALCKQDTEIFSDELNHASLIDGIRLSKALYQIYPHCDLEKLEMGLQKSKAFRKVIVTESVFSMDGNLAPLSDLRELARKYQAFLIVDEAHSTGTIGPGGLGSTVAYSDENLIAIHTCSKALGAYGAFVVCHPSVRDLLINRSRSFIYTTALPPLSVRQIQFAIEELLTSTAHSTLTQNVLFFSQQLGRRPTSPIFPFVIGSNLAAQEASLQFENAGFRVVAIRSPTVAKGTERLRVTVNSIHKTQDLTSLAQLLKGRSHV